MMQVSILCPNGDVQLDWRSAYGRLSEALASAGIAARALPWTGLDQAQVPDAVACLAWGYHLEPGRWTRLLQRRLTTGSLVNSARAMLWNSDKIYLEQLATRVPVVPTHFTDTIDPGLLSDLRDRFRSDVLIVKPRWGASGHGLTIVHERDPVPDLTDVLVQPRLNAIEQEGEVSLVFFGERFSHAVRKLAAPGEIRVQSDFGGSVEAFSPSEELVALGEKALSAAPSSPAYARVDLVMGNEGEWQVMELELIEPELFLEFSSDGPRQFGQAIRERLFNGR
jgi:glutathione synthase/RimK-type ligase-like ATP-grasp enzyme